MTEKQKGLSETARLYLVRDLKNLKRFVSATCYGIEQQLKRLPHTEHTSKIYAELLEMTETSTKIDRMLRRATRGRDDEDLPPIDPSS